MCACLCVCPKSGDVLPWSPSPLISVVRTVAITLLGLQNLFLGLCLFCIPLTAVDLVVLVSLGPNVMIILASHLAGELPRRPTSWCVLEGISKTVYLSKKDPTT